MRDGRISNIDAAQAQVANFLDAIIDQQTGDSWSTIILGANTLISSVGITDDGVNPLAPYIAVSYTCIPGYAAGSCPTPTSVWNQIMAATSSSGQTVAQAMQQYNISQLMVTQEIPGLYGSPEPAPAQASNVTQVTNPNRDRANPRATRSC